MIRTGGATLLHQQVYVEVDCSESKHFQIEDYKFRNSVQTYNVTQEIMLEQLQHSLNDKMAINSLHESVELQVLSSSRLLVRSNEIETVSKEKNITTPRKECSILSIETNNLLLSSEIESIVTRTTCSENSITADESYVITQPLSFEVNDAQEIAFQSKQSERVLSSNYSGSRQKKRIQRYYAQLTKSSPCPSPLANHMLGPGSVSKSFSFNSNRPEITSPWLSSPESSLDSSDSVAQATYWGLSFCDDQNENESSNIRNHNANIVSGLDPLHIDIVDLPAFCASSVVGAAPLTAIPSDRNSLCSLASSSGWWSPDAKQATYKKSKPAPVPYRYHAVTGRQQHSLQRALHVNFSPSSTEGVATAAVPVTSSSSASSSSSSSYSAVSSFSASLLSPAGAASGRQQRLKPAWLDETLPRHVDNSPGPGSCSKDGSLDLSRRQQLLTNLLTADVDLDQAKVQRRDGYGDDQDCHDSFLFEKEDSDKSLQVRALSQERSFADDDDGEVHIEGGNNDVDKDREMHCSSARWTEY